MFEMLLGFIKARVPTFNNKQLPMALAGVSESASDSRVLFDELDILKNGALSKHTAAAPTHAMAPLIPLHVYNI